VEEVDLGAGLGPAGQLLEPGDEGRDADARPTQICRVRPSPKLKRP
jgi:hypothetical protein